MIRIAPLLGAVLLLHLAGPAFAGQDAGVDTELRQPTTAEIEEQKKRVEAERRYLEELHRREAEQRQQKPAEEKKREEEQAAREEKKEEKKNENKKEPELNLPIGMFILAGVFTGLGVLTGVVAAPLERDLRDPGKHRTPATTQWIYDRARATGFVSKGFYGLAGIFTGWAGFKTQGAIRDYLQAKAGLADASRLEKDGAFALTPVPDDAPLSVETCEPGFLISPFGLEVRF